MPQSFSQTPPVASSASVDTRELVSRLSLDQLGVDDSTIRAVSEATGKSIEVVRTELEILRLEKRVAELEARSLADPMFTNGRRGGFIQLLMSLKGAGIAGQLVMVCLGIAMIVFTCFLGIAMIH